MYTLCRLCADAEANVLNAVQFLDNLVKVSGSHAFAEQEWVLGLKLGFKEKVRVFPNPGS